MPAPKGVYMIDAVDNRLHLKDAHDVDVGAVLKAIPNDFFEEIFAAHHLRRRQCLGDRLQMLKASATSTRASPARGYGLHITNAPST